MKVWRRCALAAAAALGLTALALGVAALPPVQRSLGRQLVARAAAATGWWIEADELRLRVWPARLAVRELALGPHPGEAVARLQEGSASWGWFRLLGGRPRLEVVALDGLEWDLAPLALGGEGESAAGTEALTWVEVADFRLEDAGGLVPSAVATVRCRGLRAGASLLAGRLGLQASVASLAAEREGRVLELGRLEARVAAGPDGVEVHGLSLDGGAVSLELEGRLTHAGPAPVARGEASLSAPLAPVLAWWDPGLVAQAAASGTLRLELKGEAAPDGRIRVEGGGHDLDLEVAGYGVRGLRLQLVDGNARIEVSGDGWGEAWAEARRDGVVHLVAALDRASVDPARPRLPVASAIPHGVELTGSVDVRWPWGEGVEAVAGRGDLEAVWPEGRLGVSAEVAGQRVVVRDLVLELPGLRATAQGRGSEDGQVEGEGRLVVRDPARAVHAFSQWVPALEQLPPLGGAAEIDLRLGGSWSAPHLDAVLVWTEPRVGELELRRLEAGLAGTMGGLIWELEAELAEGGELMAEGVAFPRDRAVEGRWRAADLLPVELSGLVDLDEPPGGVVDAEGEGRWSGDEWRLSGDLTWSSPAWRGWRAESVEASLVGSPSGVSLGRAVIDLGQGVVRATGEVGPAGRGWPLRLSLEWEDLPVAVVAPALPPGLDGALEGAIELGGTVTEPTAVGTALFVPSSPGGALGPVDLRLSAQGGRLEALTERFETAAGPLVLEVDAPLGDLPRPEWLWPGAPSGPVRLTVEGCGLEAAPLVAALGVEAPDGQLRFGLSIDGRLDLADLESSRLRVELPDLVLEAAGEELVADVPPVVTLRDRRLEMAPVRLVGRRTELSLSAVFDLARAELEARVDAVLAPEMVELLQPMLSVRGPLALSVVVEGPIGEPIGSAVVDHRGGALIVRDPPLELSDLLVVARLDGDSVTIREGRAGLNGGVIHIGGGWSPKVRQGVVVELEDVRLLLPYGILTMWDGLVALEPRDQGRSALVGELTLDGGLWDREFDLASALALQTGGGPPPAVDDPLESVDLDLRIGTSRELLVDNNIGRMRLDWRTLEVQGTIARPEIRGRIDVHPGGVVLVRGQPSRIVRGRIELSGEEGADPELDLVVNDEGSGYGLGSTRQVGLADLVSSGAVSTVSRLFGLRNTALRPAEISFATSKDPTTRFTVSRALGRNAALFISSDLTTVQDAEGVLQVGGWSAVPGLVLQGFSSTADGEGLAAIERLQWGGTRREEKEEPGPVLSGSKFEGEWPLSRRRLKKAVGLRSGQGFDPFFVFIGEVRLERALAAEGYPLARVEGREEGSGRKRRLVFRCDAGQLSPVSFVGDDVPRKVEGRVAGLHRPGLLEASSLEEMRELLEQELGARGYPWAVVGVTRRGSGVEVEVHQGEKLELEDVVLKGVPVESARTLAPLLASPASAAALARGDGPGRRRVEHLLVAEGFPEARVEQVVLESTGAHSARVVVHVAPGPRTQVARVVLDGEDPLGVLAKPDFPVREGSDLRRRLLTAAVNNLRRSYRDAGYSGTHVSTRTLPGPGNDVEVVIELAPGVKREVTGVRVEGRRHLSERVVARGLAVAPGDPLVDSALDETARRLSRFSPLNSVEVTSRPEGASGAVVDVKIVERPRWTVGAGVRWESDRGTTLLADLRDDGLLGRGLGIAFQGQLGVKEKEGRVLIELPASPGGRLSALAWASWSEEELTLDIERKQIFSLEGRLQGDEGWFLRGYLRRERTHLYEKEPDPWFPFDLTLTLGTIGAQAVIDRRDDPFDPRSGYTAALDVSYNSPFLGTDDELEVVRSLGSLTVFLEPRSGWTWAQGLRLGVAEALQGELRRDVRFFAGGETSIRGFDRDSVGPVEEFGPVRRYTGGGALFILNQEVHVPVTSLFRLALFVDAGNVWESWGEADLKLSVGAGLGVRVSTPIGSVRADVAWPVANPGENRGAHYYFGLSQTF